MKLHRLAVMIMMTVVLLLPVNGFAQSDVEAQFKAGAAALDKNDFDTAIRLFSEVMRMDKDIPDAFQGRGFAYFQQDKYELAIADFQTAIGMYANNSDFKESKLAVLNLLGLCYFETDDFGKAFAQFDAAVTLDPSSEDSYYYRAQTQYAMGDYDKASADQDKAVKLGTTLKPVSFDRAMADMNRDIYKSPTDPKPWYNRGMAHLSRYSTARAAKPLLGRSAELEAAISDIEQSTRVDSKFASGWLQRGIIEEIDTTGMRIGPKESALPFYDKAIEANPNLGDAYARRGLLLSNKLSSKAEDVAKAKTDLAKAISLGVKDPDALVALGDLSMSMRDYDHAIASFTSVIATRPNDVKAYEKRADVYAAKEDWNPAIQDRTKIISLKPGETSAIESRARTYQSAGRFSDAAADWTTLLAKDPSGLYYSRRADNYVDLKDYPKAFADYGKAIALEPDDADHYLGRARAYRLSNDKANALADYRKAHQVDDTAPIINADLSNADVVDANRGNLGRATSRFTKSMRDMNDASAKVASDREELSNLAATLLSSLNETEDEKLIRLTKAVTAGSAKADDYTARGTIYFQKRNLDAALADFNKAIDLDAKQNDAVYYRGLIRGSKGDFDAAIADLDRFIALRQDVSDAYFYRGSAYLGKKDLDRALADLTKAISISDKNEASYIRRGDVYYARSDFDNSLADYDKAVSLNAKSAEAYYKRGNVHVMRKEFDGAISDYDKALALAPDLIAAKNNRDIAIKQKAGK